MSMNHCTALQLSSNQRITIPENESCWQSSIQSQLHHTPDELTKLIVVCKSQMDALQNCVQHLETADELNDTYLKLQTEYRYISEAVIQAEIKLGKFIAQMPKATSQNNISGKSKTQNVPDDDLGANNNSIPSKKEQIKRLGISPKQAETFQKMFKYQKVAEQAIEESRESKKSINRSYILKKIRQFQSEEHQQQYSNKESPHIIKGSIVNCNIEPNFQMIITAPPSLGSKFFLPPKEWLPKILNCNANGIYIFVEDSPTELKAYLDIKLPDEILVIKIKDSGNSSDKMYQHNHKFCLFYKGNRNLKLNFGNNRNAIQTVTNLTQAAEIFIKQAANENDTIFDPFPGEGDFILAATQIGRNAYGLEQDEDNIRIACEKGCKQLLLNEEVDVL